MAELPQQLHIRASNQPSCGGVYHLMENTVDDLPAWRMPGTDKVLVSCVGGEWGVVTEEEDGVHPKARWIRHNQKHKGALPQQMSDVWQLRADSGWRNDEDISIRAVPSSLWVKCLERQACEGVYELSETPFLGLPTWIRKASSAAPGMVLRACSDGKWALGSSDVMASEGIDSVSCWMRYPQKHRGALPLEMPGMWQWLEGSAWHSSKSISVREIPRRLYVSAAVQHTWTGLYGLAKVRGNGMPVWRKEGSDRVLYAGNNGKWIIGDRDEETLHFDCHTGWVRQPEAHASLLPHQLKSTWQWSDGKEWRSNAQIKFSTSSPTSAERTALGGLKASSMWGSIAIGCLCYAKWVAHRIGAKGDQWELHDLSLGFDTLALRAALLVGWPVVCIGLACVITLIFVVAAKCGK